MPDWFDTTTTGIAASLAAPMTSTMASLSTISSGWLGKSVSMLMVPSRSRNKAGRPAGQSVRPVASTHRPGSTRQAANSAASSPSDIGEARFDHLAQMMVEHEMPLLDDRRVGRRHVEQDVGERCELAAGVAGEGDDRHVHGARLF